MTWVAERNLESRSKSGPRVARAILPLTLVGALATHGIDARAAERLRIVAAGSAITETLFALGLESRIVGVDAGSLYPPEASRKRQVGDAQRLSADAILSLTPSLVLAGESAGPQEALKLVEDLGVRVVKLPDDPTPDGVIRRIESIGRLVDREQDAQLIARDTVARFGRVAVLSARVRKPLRAMFILGLEDGRPIVAGTGTAADSIIRLAGGVNAAASLDGVRPIADEAMAAAAPDVIVMDRELASSRLDEIFMSPALAVTPAGRDRRSVVIEHAYVLGFGPRTPEAIYDLMFAFYGDLHRLLPASGTQGVGKMQ